MPPGRYALGVDLGTTFTAAATARGAHAEILSLGDRTPEIPSVLFLREDGEFLLGTAAERRGIGDPGRVVRDVKRRLGDQTPVLLGGTAFPSHAPYSVNTCGLNFAPSGSPPTPRSARRRRP